MEPEHHAETGFQGVIEHGQQAPGRRLFCRHSPYPTEEERVIAYVRDAIDREHDSIGPSQLARVKRLKRLLAKLYAEP